MTVCNCLMAEAGDSYWDFMQYMQERICRIAVYVGNVRVCARVVYVVICACMLISDRLQTAQ